MIYPTKLPNKWKVRGRTAVPVSAEAAVKLSACADGENISPARLVSRSERVIGWFHMRTRRQRCDGADVVALAVKLVDVVTADAISTNNTGADVSSVAELRQPKTESTYLKVWPNIKSGYCDCG